MEVGFSLIEGLGWATGGSEKYDLREGGEGSINFGLVQGLNTWGVIQVCSIIWG